MDNNTRAYNDIIDLPHPTSARHPRMPICDRAAQFAPFAALTGHEDEIRETARLTSERIELDEDAVARLDMRLNIIRKNIIGENTPDEQIVTITYYVPDDRKEGGAYIFHSGAVKKIDNYSRMLVMSDNTSIPIEQIIEIEGEMFKRTDVTEY